MNSITYPKDWEIQPFSNIADFKNGAAFKPTDWKTEGLPIIRIQNLNNPEAEFNYFDGKLDERYYVKNGDILLSWSASLGVYRWNRGNAILNQHIFNVKPKGGIDEDFLFYISHNAIDDLSRKVHGSTMKHFKKRELDEAKVPVPPLVEQRGIVEVLETVDECIRLTDAVIERAGELKRGLMQQLLTRGIGHTEYKETSQGRIPITWKIVKIIDVCDKPQYGYTASANEKPIGPKFLRITDIKDGVVNWAEVPYCKYSTDDRDKYRINKGDIVFARTGATTGKSYLIKTDVEAIFASYLIRLKARKEVDPRFLYLFFNSDLYWKQIRQRMVGSAQGGVNATVLSKLDLPYPPIVEQKKIADIFFEIESYLSSEKKKKEQLSNLKQGLMQILLSGKIRVELKGDELQRIRDSREANN